MCSKCQRSLASTNTREVGSDGTDDDAAECRTATIYRAQIQSPDLVIVWLVILPLPSICDLQCVILMPISNLVLASSKA